MAENTRDANIGNELTDARRAAKPVDIVDRVEVVEVDADRRPDTDRKPDGGDVSPHLGGRAQPGDILGIETAGETTELGDTAEDENERRRDNTKR
jgi:hypothetical protein